MKVYNMLKAKYIFSFQGSFGNHHLTKFCFCEPQCVFVSPHKISFSWLLSFCIFISNSVFLLRNANWSPLCFKKLPNFLSYFAKILRFFQKQVAGKMSHYLTSLQIFMKNFFVIFCKKSWNINLVVKSHINFFTELER